MSEEKNSNEAGLVPAGNRGLTNRSTKLLQRGLDLLRPRDVYFPMDRSVGSLDVYDSEDTKFDDLYGYTSGKYLGEARGHIRIPENKDLWLTVNDEGAKDFSFFTVLGPNDLQALSSGSANFEEEELVHIANLTGLRKLLFGSPGTTDNSVANIKKLVALQWLDLSFTRISDKALSHLHEMTRLRLLDLEKTLISDDGARQLSRLPALEQLSLADTEVGDVGIVDVSRVTSLRALNLSYTKVTDAGLASCQDLKGT